MKHLKPYNESKNYNEISNTLEDICIYLEDDGFTIKLFEDINSNGYPEISVGIFKDGLYFYKDIKEALERMIKYMDGFDYEFFVGRSRFSSYNKGLLPHDDDYIRYHFKIVFDEKENKSLVLESTFVSKEDVDDLLDKINSSGITSLSDIDKNRLTLFSEGDKEIIETIEKMADITNKFRELNTEIRRCQSSGKSDGFHLMKDWGKLNDQLRPL